MRPSVRTAVFRALLSAFVGITLLGGVVVSWKVHRPGEPVEVRGVVVGKACSPDESPKCRLYLRVSESRIAVVTVDEITLLRADWGSVATGTTNVFLPVDADGLPGR